MKRTSWVAGLLVTQFAYTALAQNRPTAAPPQPLGSAVSTPEGAAPSAASPTSSSSPSIVEMDDPMLVPLEPPEHVLANWREALDHVRNRSTDYRIAVAQIEAARGQSRMVLARSLPQLVGDASIQHHLLTGENINPFLGRLTPQPYPNPRWQAGLTLTVPVLSARNWYDYGTSRDEIRLQELNVEDAQRLIIGGLAESLVSVITAERLAEVTRVNLSAALSNLDLNQRRALLGAGNAIDVLRARQEVESSRAQLVQADETVRKSRESLGAALGYAEAWGVPPDIKMDQLRQDARDTCETSSSIKDRSDVRAAAAGAAIAKRNVNSVDFSFLPTIDFSTGLTYFPNDLQSPNREHVTWTIGASLSWHLYDGGLRYGEKQLNLALWEQSQQQSIQVERDATIQVRQAVREVSVAKQSLDVATQSQTIAEDNAQLARAKFLNGSGNSFDLVDTQRAARQTKLDVTVKEFELLRAEIIAFLALATCEI